MKYILFFFFLSVSTQTIANDAVKYLCITDDTVGFTYNKNNKKWRGAVFKNKDRYIISPSPLKKYKYSVYRFGDAYTAFSNCKNGFEKELLSCEGLVEFSFNKKLNRFILNSTIGYTDGVDTNNPNSMFCEGCNSPHMQIGRCSRI